MVAGDFLFYGIDLMKDPAFLFYFQDFLVGTEFMNNEEKGIYITILCHLADKGTLSHDQILSICKGYAFSEMLQNKFKLNEEGKYYNERLRYEVAKRKKYAEGRRENAKGQGKAYAKHMENENKNVIESKTKSKVVNNKNKKPNEIVFETIWKKYPSKDGRKEAERHFNVSVLTLDDFSNIKKALTNYINHLKNNSWKKPKNGSTWFNNWQDWINWIEPVPETDELDDARKKLGLIKE